MTEINPVEIERLPGNSAIFELEDVALFLDLDGTLAPIVQHPSQVGPDLERNRLLAELVQRLCGRLAVISGRTIEEVDRILDGAVVAVAGVHGLERRTGEGRRFALEPHPDLSVAKAALGALAKARGGLVMEDKGLSVALHYRQIPAAAEAVRELAHRLAATTGLVLQEGKMVVELRTPGPHKGDAVATFMNEPPFAGARPVYIGDDLTDEDAFATAAVAGGYGILVGPPRETWAAWRLNGVDDVLAWIATGIASLDVSGGEARA